MRRFAPTGEILPLPHSQAFAEVREACQCVTQFNSIKRRFELQIKMQITSVIKECESAARDKVHPSLCVPGACEEQTRFLM